MVKNEEKKETVKTNSDEKKKVNVEKKKITIKKEVEKKEKIKVDKIKEKEDKIVAEKESTEPIEEVSIEASDSYFEAVGRRKTSVAVVRLFTKGKKEFIVNDKPYNEYFPTLELQESCSASLKRMKCFETFRITVKVNGGGINSQMEAVRHGISRALILFNIEFKKKLRRAGYLTRDPRQRERKKPGLKRARRAPQWKKR
jgi:small subunit ribosomal protein S9